jgi:hypothetical protein
MGSQNLRISLADGSRYDKLPEQSAERHPCTQERMNSKAAKEAAVDDGKDD